VRVAFKLYGHDADWPSLRPREPDHETTTYSSSFEMELVGQKWLIYKST
jgi:hypothetical protein